MSTDLCLTRREALAAGIAVMGGLMSSTLSAAEDDLPWIDAHSHIWPPEADIFPLAPGLTKKDLNPPSFTDDELMSSPNNGGAFGLKRSNSIYFPFVYRLLAAIRRNGVKC